MRKSFFGSIVMALLLVGAGCFGAKPPVPQANVPQGQVAPDENGSPDKPEPPHPVSETKAAQFGMDVSLQVGDTLSLPDGLAVTLSKINDSRCPQGVQCIWQGELSPVLSIHGGNAGQDPKEVTLGTVRALQASQFGYAFSLHEATATTITLSVAKEGASVKGDDRISVTSPKPGATVSSPLTVTGKARGSWYFEASFPVELQDANGKVLVQVPAHAKGDWMTEDFVPFEVTLTFPKPATATGTLILHRDNPSGLPQNEASISIPVTFTANK